MDCRRKRVTMSIERLQYPTQHVVFRAWMGPADELTGAIEQFVRDVRAAGATPLGPPLALYPRVEHDPQATVARLCIPVPEQPPRAGDLRTIAMDPVDVLVARHDGGWHDLHEAYDALSAWIDDHGLKVAEGVSETFRFGPLEGAPPETWCVDVAVRIKAS